MRVPSVETKFDREANVETKFDREAYVEAVLQAVESIPTGRVASYGDLAELVGRGGPRQVGAVLSHFGSTVCWWRVVRSDGRPARGHEQDALVKLRAEGVVLRGERADLKRCRWGGPRKEF